MTDSAAKLQRELAKINASANFAPAGGYYTPTVQSYQGGRWVTTGGNWVSTGGGLSLGASSPIMGSNYVFNSGTSGNGVGAPVLNGPAPSNYTFSTNGTTPSTTVKK